MKKKTILTALAAAAIAVGAQAQTRKVVPSGQAYTIGNVISASGDNVTYQWFRDGVAISGATGESYTVPANLAKHENGLETRYTSGAKFQRAAYGIDCLGGAAMSNMIIISFCDLIVNGVCWARANADGSIVSNPWDLGNFYQWNRPNVGYSTTSPVEGVPVGSWNTTSDLTATWTNGFPCPAGWRIPAMQELQNLYTMSQPAGGVWVEGGARGIPVGVNGKIFGYNTTYCTMSSMSGCVFLPAAGYRANNNGALSNPAVQGRYWTSSWSGTTSGYYLNFSNQNIMISTSNLYFGLSIRCVQDVQ